MHKLEMLMNNAAVDTGAGLLQASTRKRPRTQSETLQIFIIITKTPLSNHRELKKPCAVYSAALQEPEDNQEHIILQYNLMNNTILGKTLQVKHFSFWSI